MYSQEVKNKFVQMRAEGKSFSAIIKELNISKGTCCSWEKELADSIKDLKQERLEELYEAYQMGKEARIKRLGSTLQAIDDAIADADFSEVPLFRLLDMKLKYAQAMKEEYISPSKPFSFTGSIDAEQIVSAIADLWERVNNGEATSEQASKESVVLTSLLRAYEQTVLKGKLEALENILASRG